MIVIVIEKVPVDRAPVLHQHDLYVLFLPQRHGDTEVLESIVFSCNPAIYIIMQEHVFQARTTRIDKPVVSRLINVSGKSKKLTFITINIEILKILCASVALWFIFMRKNYTAAALDCDCGQRTTDNG